jgi:selenide,water dikinase
MQAAPLLKDLVLVGGGHAHVHVVKSFGMKPMPGVRVTLIGRDIETPYSGMIPGFVAGRYTFDECHIDLARLCAWSGARLIHAEATGLDRDNRRVLLKDRPPLSYDVVSLDIGSAPNVEAIAGAAQWATPVKPIAELGRRWLAFLERMASWLGPLNVVVIGGGAGGVELALGIDHRLRDVATGAALQVTLVTKGEILAGQAPAARQKMRRVFERRGLRLLEHAASKRIERGAVQLEDGKWLDADAVFVVTEASAAKWLASTGLPLDERGFLAVDDTLASTGDPLVFAVGDCATVLKHPRPKAGVFAVRQGPPLAKNLRRVLLGEEARPFVPQSRYLSILGTGDGRAVATRNGWAAEGAWVWRWKDYIDRKWMRMYREAPTTPMQQTAAAPDPRLADAEARRLLADIGMRCGGCGAKVGANALSRVLARLGLFGREAADDAAIIEVPAGKALVQSVDFFRTFIDDPYVFGEVAAVHALGDVWAMGAKAHSALALAVVPAAAERLMEEDLFQMLAGARHILDGAGCALIGGHSGEGPEMALGFSVNGVVDPARALRKGGLRPGDKLVLSKPLGTGVIFAAAMRGLARGSSIASALDSMRRPSGKTADDLVANGAHACTDVTGFGLAGHLAEMIRATIEPVAVDLSLDALPALDGASGLFARGIASSLQPENLRARHLIDGMDRAAGHAKLPLLFDPQTAGGLLAAVPADAVGRVEGVVIGEVQRRDEGRSFIRLID